MEYSKKKLILCTRACVFVRGEVVEKAQAVEEISCTSLYCTRWNMRYSTKFRQVRSVLQGQYWLRENVKWCVLLLETLVTVYVNIWINTNLHNNDHFYTFGFSKTIFELNGNASKCYSCELLVLWLVQAISISHFFNPPFYFFIWYRSAPSF